MTTKPQKKAPKLKEKKFVTTIGLSSDEDDQEELGFDADSEHDAMDTVEEIIVEILGKKPASSI